VRGLDDTGIELYRCALPRCNHRNQSRRNRDILLNSNRTLGNCDAKDIGRAATVAFTDSADESPQRGGYNGDCAKNGVNLRKHETGLGSWCDVDDETID
jgi:hypothetical protein